MLVYSVNGLDLFADAPQVHSGLSIAAAVIFGLAVLLSWTSFLDYLQVFRASRRERQQ